MIGTIKSMCPFFGGADNSRVCEVEVLLGKLRRHTGPGVFYRLQCPLRKEEATEDSVYAGEFDVRERVVGLWEEPRDDQDAPIHKEIARAEHCLVFFVESEGHNRWIYRREQLQPARRIRMVPSVFWQRRQ